MQLSAFVADGAVTLVYADGARRRYFGTRGGLVLRRGKVRPDDELGEAAVAAAVVRLSCRGFVLWWCDVSHDWD